MATQTAGDSNECEIMQILFHCRLKHFPKVFREAAPHAINSLPAARPAARPGLTQISLKKALSTTPTTFNGHLKIILPF